MWAGAVNCLILLTMALLPKVRDMLGAQMVGFSRVNVRVSVMIRVRFSFSGMNLCQLEPPPPIPLTYIRVRAVVWEIGMWRGTDRHTGGHESYSTFRLRSASHKM